MIYPRRIRNGPLGAFPVELYEHVMDCIQSDGVGEDGIRDVQKALCSCALTCQAWLPRSRLLLYHSVTLFSSEAYPCNRAVIRRLANTTNSSTLLADLIEHFTISKTLASKSSAASVLPLLLINELPKLRTLTMQRTALVVNAAFCHSIAKFPALTTLSLAQVEFANFSAFRRLLAALPRLRDLKLEEISWQTVGIWRHTTSQYARQMPRVPKVSMVGGQVVGPATRAALELLAPHIEQLVFSEWDGPELLAEDKDDTRLVFENLTSLTLRGPLEAVVSGLGKFLSESQADRLRAIILIMIIRTRLSGRSYLLSGRWQLPPALWDAGMLERMVLGAGLSQLRSVTVAVEMWGSSRPTVERLEEQMPAVVEEYREELSSLHRRGVLRVAGAALVDGRKDETWVWVAPDEGTHTAPLVIKRCGMPLLDAIINTLDKALM